MAHSVSQCVARSSTDLCVRNVLMPHRRPPPRTLRADGRHFCTLPRVESIGGRTSHTSYIMLAPCACGRGWRLDRFRFVCRTEKSRSEGQGRILPTLIDSSGARTAETMPGAASVRQHIPNFPFVILIYKTRYDGRRRGAPKGRKTGERSSRLSSSAAALTVHCGSCHSADRSPVCRAERAARRRPKSLCNKADRRSGPLKHRTAASQHQRCEAAADCILLPVGLGGRQVSVY